MKTISPFVARIANLSKQKRNGLPADEVKNHPDTQVKGMPRRNSMQKSTMTVPGNLASITKASSPEVGIIAPVRAPKEIRP
jgi:hypothetical protein